MSIVLSRSMVLTDAVKPYDEQRVNGPVIGWQNLIEFGGISAQFEDPLHRVVNLANPATHLFWRSTTMAQQTLTFVLSDIRPIDYVGLARHNLGSAGTPIRLEYRAGGGGEAWLPLYDDIILPNDNPVIIRFPERDASQIRVTLDTSQLIPELAVIYVGKLLQLQRNIYVGHTPINFGRQTRVTNGRSESGNFLGRVVTGRRKVTGISLQNLTPRWYRARMEPFVAVSEETPFFFAWRPDGYPREVGYCWTTSDIVPTNQRQNGMMSVDFDIAGIAGDGLTVVVED